MQTDSRRGIALSGFNTTPPSIVRLGGVVALVALFFEIASGLFRPITGYDSPVSFWREAAKSSRSRAKRSWCALKFATRPAVATAFDTDPEAAVLSRQRVFDMVVADGLLVGGMHLHFPGLGHGAVVVRILD
jgi:hypothetical protein